MKITMLAGLSIGLLALAAGAYGQTCPKAQAANEQLLEQLLLLRFAKDCELSDYSVVEMLQGYEEYSKVMSGLAETRTKTSGDLQAAVDGGKSGSEIASLLNASMEIDRQILATKQQAVNEAAVVLTPAQQAKLYLMVADMDAAKREAIAAMVGAPCPMAAQAASPVAVEPAGAALSPEDEIMNLAKEFTSKLAAKEIDVVAQKFSDDFYHSELGDKDGARDFLQQAADMGYLDDIEIDFDDAQAKVEGDEAEVYPVKVDGNFGSLTLRFLGKKEKGEWKLSSLDVSGL